MSDLASPSSEQQRITAWNAQPLSTWSHVDLSDRAFAPEYDLHDALDTTLKMAAALVIQTSRLTGRDLMELVGTIRNLQHDELHSAISAWLPSGNWSHSQLQVCYRAIELSRFNFIHSLELKSPISNASPIPRLYITDTQGYVCADFPEQC